MARRLPPLNAVRAFEAAARTMSFTRAADELNVTPAAISRHVKLLEEILRVPLFRRLPRGLILTDAGRAYLPALSDALDRIAQASELARGGALKGILTVSVMPSFATGWLVPRLNRFRARYPDLDVLLRSETRLVDFASEDVDLAIRYSRPPFPGLRTALLMTEEVFPVCSPALARGQPGLRRLDDLCHHTLLHDVDAGPRQPWIGWDVWLREAGLIEIEAMRGPRFTDSGVMIQAAIAGQGVMLGRSVLVREHLRAGALVQPFERVRRADFAYYLVAPEAAAVLPKVAAFFDWALSEAANDGP